MLRLSAPIETPAGHKLVVHLILPPHVSVLLQLVLVLVSHWPDGVSGPALLLALHPKTLDVSVLLQAVLHGLSAPRETLAHHKLAPGAMRCDLHPYQEQALSWMLAREACAGRGCPSGILADEQVQLPQILKRLGSCSMYAHHWAWGRGQRRAA